MADREWPCSAGRALNRVTHPSEVELAVNDWTGLMVRTPQWIACRNEARTVIDGEVFCPRGDLVAWQGCLECHLLEAVDDDRGLGSTELEASGPATGQQPTIDPVRWPELIIELL